LNSFLFSWAERFGDFPLSESDKDSDLATTTLEVVTESVRAEDVGSSTLLPSLDGGRCCLLAAVVSLALAAALPRRRVLQELPPDSVSSLSLVVASGVSSADGPPSSGQLLVTRVEGRRSGSLLTTASFEEPSVGDVGELAESWLPGGDWVVTITLGRSGAWLRHADFVLRRQDMNNSFT
jgi:hypothetical protein